MNYLGIKKPFLVLAPMDDVTDTVFRQIIAEIAPADLYMTEFVNADGLQSPGRPKLLKKLQFTERERPIIAQIWGKVPNNYHKTAQELVDMGFDGVDINMGCPVKTVIKNGACGALINDRDLAKEIIESTRDGLKGNIPLSVKTRLGFKDIDLSWIEFLLEQKLDMLTIHLRTVREMSKTAPHWEVLEEIVKLRDSIAPDTLFVGNGDVMNKAEALKLAKKYKIDGVMIGRGVFHDPYALVDKSPWAEMSRADKISLYKKHVELFLKTWKNNERPIITLNKFCKIYINGFDGAKELREKLMNCQTAAELLANLEQSIV